MSCFRGVRDSLPRKRYLYNRWRNQNWWSQMRSGRNLHSCLSSRGHWLYRRKVDSSDFSYAEPAVAARRELFSCGFPLQMVYNTKNASYIIKYTITIHLTMRWYYEKYMSIWKIFENGYWILFSAYLNRFYAERHNRFPYFRFYICGSFFVNFIILLSCSFEQGLSNWGKYQLKATHLSPEEIIPTKRECISFSWLRLRYKTEEKSTVLI